MLFLMLALMLPLLRVKRNVYVAPGCCTETVFVSDELLANLSLFPKELKSGSE